MTRQDQNIEQELAELRARYQSEPGLEPPELLDQAVLNRARQEAAPRAMRPWNFGWMHATASVALVVIGLTVVLELRQTPQSFDAAVPVESRPIEEDEIDNLGSARAPLSSPGRQDADQGSTSSASGSREAEEHFAAEPQGQIVRRAPRAAPMAAEDPPAETESVSTDRVQVLADSATADVPATFGTAAQDAAQGAAPSAPPPPAADVRESVAASKMEFRATERERRESDDAAPVAAPKQDMVVNDITPVAARQQDALAEPDHRASPEAWLSHLRTLLDHGPAAELEQEWREFRQAYPEFPVPEALASRMPALQPKP